MAHRGWQRLIQTFAELRNPNGFSRHAELAVKFQDARRRLWTGLFAGALFCTLAAIGGLLTLADALRIGSP